MRQFVFSELNCPDGFFQGCDTATVVWKQKTLQAGFRVLLASKNGDGSHKVSADLLVGTTKAIPRDG